MVTMSLRLKRTTRILAFVFPLAALGLTGCFTSSSLSTAEPIAEARKVERGLEVSVTLTESPTRYQAHIEIHNGTKATLHGPESVVLLNADRFVQPAISAEALKENIARNARSQAYYARNTWSSSYGYGYGWSRRYGRYGRRSRPLFLSSYRRDWLEGQMESDRILSRAQHQISSLDANYLQPQDIPPGASVAGILQFAKSNPKDTPDGSLLLSMQVGKRTVQIPLHKD